MIKLKLRFIGGQLHRSHTSAIYRLSDRYQIRMPVDLLQDNLATVSRNHEFLVEDKQEGGSESLNWMELTRRFDTVIPNTKE